MPLTDEDALAIVRRLKYEYAPKGTEVVRAFDSNKRFYFILAGKVACSLPNDEEVQR